MLTVRNIEKSFGRTQVLAGISLSCKAGEAVCVAGMNATGKTTLLSVIAKTNRADSGDIVCSGKIGYIPQETPLVSEFTVKEHLRLWYAAHHLPERELFSADAVETRLGLAPYARYRFGKLSGGLKKRVLFACVLAGNPDILLLDEPFTALDIGSRADIIRELRMLKEQNKVILLTSHDPSAIAQIADRVLLLENGTIQEECLLEGSVKERTMQIVHLVVAE